MSETTPVLGLPLTAAGQAQKHVTVNEALLKLDALVQLRVLERNRDTPPVTPADGDRYIVGSVPTGAFVGHAGAVARFDAGAWDFLVPDVGWCAYVAAENALLAFDGAAWAGISPTGGITALQSLERLGLGTTADAFNPLSVKVNNALFSAASAPGGSGDLRVKLNKDLAVNTVSQLYQSGYAGRAETGLIGDDQFAIKVSADGTNWKQALVIDPASGVVSLPFGLAGAGGGTTAVQALGNVGLAASAAGGALTLSLTTAAGGEPSGVSRCVIPFRSASAAAGTTTLCEVMVATTLTLSAGSTLGLVANRPSKLWIVAFDDGGTLRLGAINCRDAGNRVHPLAAQDIASASAEGGAGAADAAHIVYAEASVAAKPCTVLGCVEWSSGLSAPGTWMEPDGMQVFAPGTALPGRIVQQAADRYTAFSSSTAQIPLDDTIPQNTEGAQVASVSITPKSPANLLRVRASGNFSASAAAWCTFACFLNSTADAFLSNSVVATTNVWAFNFVGEHTIGASGPGAQTLALRFGIGGAGTWAMNGAYSAFRIGGGSQGTVLSVEEIAA